MSDPAVPRLLAQLPEPAVQLVVNIMGEQVALGPRRRDLLPLYQRWRNDFAMQRMLGIWRPVTLEEEAKWYEALTTPETSTAFTIYERETGQPIGTTALSNIDFRNRTAQFTILVGEPGFRGKGYGTEATRLVLDYAFAVLGLHNVMLGVYEFNRAAIRVYEKAGFREYGRRRQCYYMGGRMWDTLYMDCLATEFTSLVPSRVLAPDERGAS